MSPRLVVFDWDGTLTDSLEPITAGIRVAIERAGLPPRSDEAIREIIGLGVAAGIARLYPQAPGEARVALANVQADPAVRAHTEQPAPLFAGARELVEALAGQGTLLAIATGKGRDALQRDLVAAGLADRFAAVRTADDGPGKPAPAPLLALLEETGTWPGEAVVVGDTLYDLQMAQAAGVEGIGVTWGVHPAERLHTGGPRAVVERLEDLSDLLTGRGGASGWESGSR